MTDPIVEGMDKAAEEAEQQLREMMGVATEEFPITLENIMGWWSDWYLKAGHKRLGRILVKLEKERLAALEEQEQEQQEG